VRETNCPVLPQRHGGGYSNLNHEQQANSKQTAKNSVRRPIKTTVLMAIDN